MSAYLVYGEAEYLLLVARRVLNFQRKAEDAGEEYHDLQSLTNLQCGFAAKLRFKRGKTGQYVPEVVLGASTVKPAVDQSLPTMVNVATEILGSAAVLCDEFGGGGNPYYHVFRREEDA